MSVIAFCENRRVAQGALAEVFDAARKVAGQGEPISILAFDAVTSRPVELDLRGEGAPGIPPFTAEDEPARGRGRPKLGVTAREVTLLPRHWDWLNAQRGGASAALRRLVEDARRADAAVAAQREGRESLYRFITAMAGDAPGYEEAVRALFADDEAKFRMESAGWPEDVRTHALTLLDAALGRTPLDALIPADRLADVHRGLAAALPGRTVEAAQRMSWGFSGAGVFKIIAGGTAYLLRLDNPPGPFGDPARQYACQAIAAEAGVAPALLYADAQARISLSRFVEAAPFPAARPVMLSALASAVRRLHDAPLFAATTPYFEAMDLVLGPLAQSDVLPRAAIAAAIDGYRRVRSAYIARPDDIVSTHHDLNPSNILFEGGHALFVDWETASSADRYVDLAGLTNFFAANGEEADAILAVYFGRATTVEEQARALLMRQVNRLFYAALLIATVARERADLNVSEGELAAIPPFTQIRDEMASLATAAGRLRIGCAFVNEALAGFEAPTFGAALAEVA